MEAYFIAVIEIKCLGKFFGLSRKSQQHITQASNRTAEVGFVPTGGIAAEASGTWYSHETDPAVLV